jgi:23S rRNA (cytidine1920-2'-O)/16S rRNA (cytidine1409-2'-O)-methyltransferase
MPEDRRYVGRGGEKLEFAIRALGLDLEGLIGADFGCNMGGFTDCLLQHGVTRVHAVDTGYGMLAWKLRQDDRVVVMERTNAMHVELPEALGVVAIDVAWTRQRNILPSALRQCAPDGIVLSLFKPQYEAPKDYVRRGRIQPERFDEVLEMAVADLGATGMPVAEVVRLPHERKAKNPEAILFLRRSECATEP